MKHTVRPPDPSLRADALVLGRFSGKTDPKGLPPAVASWLKEALTACTDFKAGTGSVLAFPFVQGLGARAVIVVGLGEAREFTQRVLRRCLIAGWKAAAGQGRKTAEVLVDSFTAPEAFGGRKGRPLWTAKGRTAGVSAHEASYRFDRYKSRKSDREGASLPEGKGLEAIAWVIGHAADRRAFEEGLAWGDAVGHAQSQVKDLMNMPPNDLYPESFAKAAQQTLRGLAGVKIEVFDEREMEKMEVGGLLAVGRGSARPPRLVKIVYTPPARAKKPLHYALVGKGITFDSGGISIKPGANMDEMKYDMCGAAGVLGTVAAAARLKLPARITAYLTLAENMPGSRAQRPGDIVRMIDGQTVAVLNTDAEGRLVMADALVMASRLKPDAVIDMATLTGACVIALGNQAAGLMGHGEDLLGSLRDIGERIGERAWPLPLYAEYHESIQSNVADMKNIGGRGAGPLTAGAFLQKFVDRKIPWAHLDIAGVAWREGEKSTATGYGVWLLTELVSGART